MSSTIQCTSAATRASPRRWWALAVVVAAQFMFVVDAFIVNVAIPTIRADLGATDSEIQALIAVYQIAYATLVITGGRLGDIFGRRRVFIAGVLAFTAMSLWCGLAGSGMELVLARLAQGATAALMVPQVLATIHTLFPDTSRGRAFAIFGIALGLGGAAGFLIGGWIVSANPLGLGWRAVFLVNLPVGATIVLAAPRLMPLVPRRSGTKLDLSGAMLLFLALTCLIVPVMAARQYGWAWWLWLAMAGGAILLALLPRLERRVQRLDGLPLIDLALLADHAFLRGLATVFSFQFGNLAFYLIVTLFLQMQLGFSPLKAGMVMMPLGFTFTVASQLAGRWMAQGDRIVLLKGSAIQFVAVLLLAALAARAARPETMALVTVLAVFGFGQGLVMAPLSGVVLATVRPAHAGSGSGMLNTVHQAGGATGVSLVGAVYFLGGSADRVGLLAALALLGLSILATAGLLARMLNHATTTTG